MTKKEGNGKRLPVWAQMLISVVIAVVLSVGAMVALSDVVVTQGTTNFDTIKLSNDLTVGDDLTVTDDATITGDFTLSGALIGSSYFTATRLFVDSGADEVPLTVQLYATPTVNSLVVENSSGTDLFAVDASGNLVTAGEFDEAITVDGEADEIQLTVSGYTTQTSSLLVLEQSGGTDKLTVSNEGNVVVGGTVDVASTLQYGADDLYPLGYASSGEQVVVGTSTMTTTAVAAHGLTTVTWALCTLGEDPETGDGDAAACTVAISANVVTIKTWQDDFTAATETDVVVHWMVIGTP